jgi:hypothetical protein
MSAEFNINTEQDSHFKPTLRGFGPLAVILSVGKIVVVRSGGETPDPRALIVIDKGLDAVGGVSGWEGWHKYEELCCKDDCG